MPGQPFLKFFVADWLSDPQLARCAPATRGIWMDALCIMHETGCATVRGTPDQLCQILRCGPAALEAAYRDLEETKAADVSRDISGISITSRRMKRDLKKAKLCASAGRKGGGNPQLRDKTTYIGRSKGGGGGDPKATESREQSSRGQKAEGRYQSSSSIAAAPDSAAAPLCSLLRALVGRDGRKVFDPDAAAAIAAHPACSEMQVAWARERTRAAMARSKPPDSEAAYLRGLIENKTPSPAWVERYRRKALTAIAVKQELRLAEGAA